LRWRPYDVPGAGKVFKVKSEPRTTVTLAPLEGAGTVVTTAPK
jgi:hypothetical protein